jgi:hypothetical protein
VLPHRDLVVVTTTELDLDDATSHGIPVNVMVGIIEDAIVSQFSAE